MTEDTSPLEATPAISSEDRRALFESAQGYYKLMLLLSGGGAVAILGFLSSHGWPEKGSVVGLWIWTVASFVLTATLSLFSLFCVHRVFYESLGMKSELKGTQEWSSRCDYLHRSTAVSTLFCFMLGCISGYIALGLSFK